MKLNLLTKTFALYSNLRLIEINKIKKEPVKVQQDFLFELLNKVKDTEYGRKYNFENIKTLEDFQRIVPIVTYEDLAPYIERMMQGEENILCSGLVENFSKSSGTTARSKFLPVSEEILETTVKGGQDQLIFYLKNNPASSVLEGKTIFLGGSLDKIKDNPEIYAGDVSAILMHELPTFWQYFRKPSLEIATMQNYEEKIERIIEETVDEDIRSLAGTPTWTLALINKIVEKKKVKNILEVWPNLEIFFHGAVSFTPYREIFKQMIPSENMHYIEIYNASEGFIAVQDDLTKNSELWLAPDYGIFYEFIPMSEYGKENPKVYTMADVKVGENYALVMTNNSGLYRYIIGDTVSFTTLFPHRIKITGRTKHFINAFGEEVLVHNTDEALRITCEKTNSNIADYTAAPIFMKESEGGGHEWIVEFIKEPENLENFIDILDSTLRSLNSDYDAKRKGDIVLKKLTLHKAPSGSFYNWMKSRGKLGGQNKVPRLSNSREYVESILEFLK
jgi:hypothetical protein